MFEFDTKHIQQSISYLKRRLGITNIQVTSLILPTEHLDALVEGEVDKGLAKLGYRYFYLHGKDSVQLVPVDTEIFTLCAYGPGIPEHNSFIFVDKKVEFIEG